MMPLSTCSLSLSLTHILLQTRDNFLGRLLFKLHQIPIPVSDLGLYTFSLPVMPKVPLDKVCQHLQCTRDMVVNCQLKINLYIQPENTEVAINTRLKNDRLMRMKKYVSSQLADVN